MTAPELKPCPFCGGEARSFETSEDSGDYYAQVRCNGCGAEIVLWSPWTASSGDRATAINDCERRWNTRTHDPDLDRAKREARVEGMERAAYCRTGIYDKDGREICVGDHIVIDLTSPGTKKEYWLPEYEVMFKPPHFTLKYIGGGMDSDTARFRFSSPHRENSKTITTIRALIEAEERGEGKLKS